MNGFTGKSNLAHSRPYIKLVRGEVGAEDEPLDGNGDTGRGEGGGEAGRAVSGC